MNAEHRALAEYLEDALDRKLDVKLDQKLDEKLDQRFKKVDEQFKEVNRNIYNLTMHVDGKNDRQGDEIQDHEQRISALESDYRVLTS